MPTVPAVRHADGPEVDFREAIGLERARVETLRREADSLEQFVNGVEAFVEKRLSRMATIEIGRLQTALAGINLWLSWAGGTPSD